MGYIGMCRCEGCDFQEIDPSIGSSIVYVNQSVFKFPSIGLLQQSRDR